MSYVRYGSPRDRQYRASILAQSHNIMASRQDLLVSAAPPPGKSEFSTGLIPLHKYNNKNNKYRAQVSQFDVFSGAYAPLYTFVEPIPAGKQLTAIQQYHRINVPAQSQYYVAINSQVNIVIPNQWLLLLTPYADRLRSFTGVVGYNPSMSGNLVPGAPPTGPPNIGNSNSNATTTELYRNIELKSRQYLVAINSQIGIFFISPEFHTPAFDGLYTGVPGSILSRPGRFVLGSYPYLDPGTPIDFNIPVGAQMNTIIVVRRS